MRGAGSGPGLWGWGLPMAQEHQPSEAHPCPADTELQLRRDAIFCQALVAAVCTFSEQLLAALSYRYNNNGEYEESSRDASRKWLEQVAATGVLLHCQSLLSPATVVSEGPLAAWAGELLFLLPRSCSSYLLSTYYVPLLQALGIQHWQSRGVVLRDLKSQLGETDVNK